MKKEIGELLEYSGTVNDSTYIRTTSKISYENINRLKTLSSENDTITQAKIINFALNCFFEEYIDLKILDYKRDFDLIFESFQKKEENLTSTVSSLLNLSRRHRNSKDEIVQISIASLKLARRLLGISKIENLMDFQEMQSYFDGNLKQFQDESFNDQELKKVNHSLETMMLFLEEAIDDQENIGKQKYEFALRNIEVTFSYLLFTDIDLANNYVDEYFNFAKQNMPTVFNVNNQLKNDLEVLLKPFSEVLKQRSKGDYTKDKALDTIHYYLGGGNFDQVRKIIEAYGINQKFTNADLERIYHNLNMLL